MIILLRQLNTLKEYQYIDNFEKYFNCYNLLKILTRMYLIYVLY